MRSGRRAEIPTRRPDAALTRSESDPSRPGLLLLLGCREGAVVTDESNRHRAEAAYAALASGDLSSLISVVSTDVRWSVFGPDGSPFAGRYRGVAGLQAFLAQLDAVEMQRFEVLDMWASDNLVVVHGRERYRVRATGLALEGPFVHVLEFVDGQVARAVIALAEPVSAAD